ncbi:NAD kinase 2, mitochondrial [Agrilus planipennis]|uniref:NAD(+) kinase n=1 Tax=Agrilus planipennis TaxID=224129 RepID=A0A1W4XA49_AGRPL|nr:NAD kinase 2, mitochondrial [Agrilus planipennis]
MFKYKVQILKKIISGTNNGLDKNSRRYGDCKLPLKMENVLVVSKLSRLEYERSKFKYISEDELKKELVSRGTDYNSLLYNHDLHKTFENKVVESFKSFNAVVKVVNRFSLKEEQTEWADVVVPAGGDGTFLLAASRVKNNLKPVIGFNSDPRRSEGHLCLPKKYSSDITKAIDELKNGNFQWLLRSRIRTSLFCQSKKLVPKYLHIVETPEDAYSCEPTYKYAEDMGTILPFLALNEVFIGESLAAKVSHLEMYLNDSEESTNLKSSGLCVCTGTGSTSWHMSINRIPVQTVAELLRLMDIEATEDKDSLATVLADIYNQNLLFNPDDPRMGYTVRELISVGVWPQPKGLKPRGFVNKIQVRSKCIDACLVVDGGVSYEFNDGVVAVLEIKPEDALRTVILTD